MPLSPSKIIAIMEAKDISRADLARHTGIKPPHITRLLTGEAKDATISTAERLAFALKCPIAKILE